LKEALGLQLTLDDPDDRPGKKLFDLEQIHQTSRVVDRWAEHFRSSAKRFETQRVFRDSPQVNRSLEPSSELRTSDFFTAICSHMATIISTWS
jgi:hypothetical protein